MVADLLEAQEEGEDRAAPLDPVQAAAALPPIITVDQFGDPIDPNVVSNPNLTLIRN